MRFGCTRIMIRCILPAVSVSVLFVLPAVADEVSWNRFRGPNGSGISHAKTVPVRWTEKDYNWKIGLPGSVVEVVDWPW